MDKLLSPAGIMIVILVLIIALVGYIIRMYNRLVSVRELVKNAMSQISAMLESRWDALTQLYELTKNAVKAEDKTFTDIISKRNTITKDSNASEVEKDEELFAKALKQVSVVVESYPELKQDNQCQISMQSVNEYEADVKSSRMVYNDTVTKYNKLIAMFPSNIIASMFGFKAEEYFKVTETKKEAPVVPNMVD